MEATRIGTRVASALCYKLLAINDLGRREEGTRKTINCGGTLSPPPPRLASSGTAAISSVSTATDRVSRPSISGRRVCTLNKSGEGKEPACNCRPIHLGLVFQRDVSRVLFDNRVIKWERNANRGRDFTRDKRLSEVERLEAVGCWGGDITWWAAWEFCKGARAGLDQGNAQKIFCVRI